MKISKEKMGKYLFTGILSGIYLRTLEHPLILLLTAYSKDIFALQRTLMFYLTIIHPLFWVVQIITFLMVLFEYLRTVLKRSDYERNGFVENILVLIIGVLIIFIDNPHFRPALFFSFITLLVFLCLPEIISFFLIFLKGIQPVYIKDKVIPTLKKKYKKWKKRKEISSSKVKKSVLDSPLKSLEELEAIDAGTNLFKSYIQKISSFSKRISEDELEEDLDGNSYVMCVNAGWGVGKTSFVNIIENTIKSSKNRNIIWIDYKPWHFSNSTELIRDFFETLNKRVKDRFSIEILPESQTQAYVDLVTPALENSGVLGKTVSGLFNSIFKIFNKDKTLNDYKNSIRRALEKTPGKIVIFMDDIDRMEPEEVITTLKLVRLISDFPKVIFILPFDYDRVASLLIKHFTEEYKGYLQKIINSKISVGPYTSSQFLRMFEHYLGHKPNESSASKEKKRSILKQIFDTFVLEMRAKQVEEDFVKRKGDVAFSDPLFLDFRNLFVIYFGLEDFGDFWNKSDVNDANIRPFQRSVVEFYQKLGDRKYEEHLLNASLDAHGLMRIWADHKFFISWNGPIQQLGRSKSLGDQNQDADIDRKINTIREFSKNLVERGIWRDQHNLFKTIQEVTSRQEVIIGNPNSPNVSEKDRLAIEAKAHSSKYWEGGVQSSGSEFDKHKTDLDDWFVKTIVTPRDVRLLSNEFAINGWSKKTEDEITLSWWGNIVKEYTTSVIA